MRVTLALLGALAVAALIPSAAFTAPKGGGSTAAKLCQKDGWKTLVTSTGQHFTSEAECVSYGAETGILPALDSDGDSVADSKDNCVSIANSDQTDRDGDGIGDPCDNDNDNDGVPDASDNCPAQSNPGQADADGDGKGDACDEDRDGDGIANTTDNCVDKANPDQADWNNDGKGDACAPFLHWDVRLEPPPVSGYPQYWDALLKGSGFDPSEAIQIHYRAPDGTWPVVDFDYYANGEGILGQVYQGQLYGSGWGFPCTWNVTDVWATARNGAIESNHVSEADLPGGSC